MKTNIKKYTKMESPNLSSPSSSELSFSSGQLRDREAFLSSRSTWKTRSECFRAYFCILMSFSNGLQFGESIGRYGLLIFIPYAISNLFVGMPAVLVIVMKSRYVMKDVAEAWNLCPLAKGVLWMLLGSTVAIITNNFIYINYLIKYFFGSFTDNLKWGTCNSSWNTVTCYKAGKKTNALNNCLKNHSEKFCMSLNWETSGTQFWKYLIANESVVIDFSFAFCLLAASLFIVILTYKEIRSLEKMFVLLVFFPVILGVILAWVSFSTPEALVGIEQIGTFHWQWLLYPQIWVEGLENTLLFLGMSDLSLSFVSSHGEFTDDIFADVFVITFGSFFFCIFFTLPVLSVSAGSREKRIINENFHIKLFTDKEDVFTSISDALTLYPYPITLWSALTYLNWFLITISSQVMLVLSVCDLFVGLMKYDFFSTTVTFLILSVFITVSFMYFNIEFKLDFGPIALIETLLLTLTWQLFYGVDRFNHDFFFMMGYPLPFYIKWSWLTLPIMCLVILILKLYLGKSHKPHNYLCYAYVGIPCVIYFFTFLCLIVVYKHNKEKIINIFYGNPNWGPDNSLLKKSRIILASGKVNREFMYRQELNKKPLEKNFDFTEQNIVQLV